jgi:N-acetylglucosamine-6-phosphate deacetylase
MNFVDIQVNGYAGISFHGDPLTEDQIQLVADKLREHHTDVILPTITTAPLEDIAMRLRTMRELIDQDKSLGRMMPAFHIEGPCLSTLEGYRGAHNPKWIRPATPEIFKPLIDAAGGPKRVAMVTLAPEVDQDMHTTRWLADQGIIIAAGHTDAPQDVLQSAADAGLSMFTHLGNGCAIQVHRHDNIVNRALNIETLKYSVIPDGVHVPFYVIRNWIKLVGIERLVFTSDCIFAAACSPGIFSYPDGTEVEVGHDKVVRFPGTPYLAGATITMDDAHHNAVDKIGLTKTQATKLCDTLPRQLIDNFIQPD